MITIPILMYHKIADPPPQAKNPALYVRPLDFRKQMERMTSWGYTSLNFHDLLAVFNGKTPPRKAFIVTFDDGFQDNFTNAFPVLQAMNIKGTVFVVSDFIGRESDWPESKEKHAEPLLSLRQIEAMRKADISFQPHSKTHRHLAWLSGEELMEEVADSGSRIFKITGEKAVCFCYPYGNYSEKVVEAVREAGYSMACSIRRGNRYGLHERFFLPRLPVHLDTTPQRLKYRMSFFYHLEHLWKK